MDGWMVGWLVGWLAKEERKKDIIIIADDA